MIWLARDCTSDYYARDRASEHRHPHLRKRRSGWFTCALTTALLLLVAVTVL